ncbi:ARM repeat-containing protein [Mycena olivaceomarginata]|nr:ARM repeat-containing protein [Mycena olivaceomarginata]
MDGPKGRTELLNDIDDVVPAVSRRGWNKMASGVRPPPSWATANRWDRRAIRTGNPPSPLLVDRKVKALLNKLTIEKFDSISDQIVEWANKSEKEKDGLTTILVIRLVFEHATDCGPWIGMYARLCRKLMEQISPKVQDEGIKDAEGKPIAGGQLFRKYLLNRCQEDFEHGWVAKEAALVAAARKAMENKATHATKEESTEGGERGDKIVLSRYLDDYYAVHKEKRRGLGVIRLISELFKVKMLTERIMHECVKKLLVNIKEPKEEELESLCTLLSTAGSLLDTAKARAHVDVYFSRMKLLRESIKVSPRMQFMLQDVIELRERKWVPRTQVAGPTIIAAVHEAAGKETYQRTPHWRSGGRDLPRPPPKAGELSNFGKIGSNSKGLPMTFGPSSVFSGKKDNKRESIARGSSSSNMFSMLSHAAVDTSSRPTPESAAAAPAQRRRLILVPRTKPAEEGTAVTEASLPVSGSENEAAPAMSSEDADKKIAEDSKEFFAVRNLDEAEFYFSVLPTVYHSRLIAKLVGTGVEGREAHALLVADFIARIVSKDICSVDAIEEGFGPLAEILEDIAIDAPKALNNMALMMKAACFDSDQTARIAAKSMEPDSLLALLS